MTYIEGFVLAVPTANKDEYRKHAAEAAPLFTFKLVFLNSK